MVIFLNFIKIVPFFSKCKNEKTQNIRGINKNCTIILNFNSRNGSKDTFRVIF